MKYFIGLVCISISGYFFLPYEGDCVAVLDGDTVIFKRFGKEERVRLLYIDTPEVKQGAPSDLGTEYLKKRIEGKRIQLKERSLDMYGRTLAVIYLDTVDINFEMAEKGYAFLYRFQKFKNARQKRKYIEAYESAKLRRIGIFKYPEILEPYHFRRSLRR